MSHSGRSGPPGCLVLNLTPCTTADDLFPLFNKYGKVVDLSVPTDRRTGYSRGFALVRYKHADEAQKAVEKLDGRVVNGGDIFVQLAKFGPDADRSDEPVSRSRSPRPSCSRHRDEYRGDRYEGDRDRYRSRTPSRSSEYHRGHRRSRDDDDDDYSRSPSWNPVRGPLPRRTPFSQSLTLNIYVNFVNPGN